MVKNKSSKIILLTVIIVLLSFIVVSLALIVQPSRVGVYYTNEADELVLDTSHLKLTKNLTESALFSGIFLFLSFVGISIIRIFLVNEETRDKYRKLLLMLLMINIVIITILIAYYIFILVRFPKDSDKHNNYAHSLGVANIIYLITLIIVSTLGVWKVFTNQEIDNKYTFNVKLLTEGSMMVALSVILSVLSDLAGLKLPNGGSVSLSLLPIFIFAFRRGAVGGALVGFTYSIINLLIDGFFHWGSIFFDYLIPYALVGLIAGLFMKKAQAGKIGYTMLAIF